MNDNEKDDIGISISEKERPDLVLAPEFGDYESLWNSRKWLESAVEKAGAKVTGGGCGMGGADVDITLEGMRYYLTIRPAL